MRYLIYAAYGSNLLKERFMCYIKGGVFIGKEYTGCSDKSEPVDLGWMYIPHRLYFAKESRSWDKKGVAFLSIEREPNHEYYTVVRLWRISEGQFKEVQRQEGPDWYRDVITLGEKDGIEIKTITGPWENKKQRPSSEYIEVLKRGLKETTNWDDRKIEEYIKKFI